MNTEFFNKEEASVHETASSKMDGDAYVRAYNKTDLFESYDHTAQSLYTALQAYGFPDDRCMYLSEHPSAIPIVARNQILEDCRALRIATYDEPNPYYIHLTGHPFSGSKTLKPDMDIPVPDAFYQLYKSDGMLIAGQSVHTLPDKYMELFLGSTYYQDLLKEYPDVEYIRHMGSYAIPIHISRNAHDGDILHINTSKLHMRHEIFGNVTVEPEIIHAFTTTYQMVQNYVYGTLRGDFSSIYENYNSFIRFLTIYLTIGNCLNAFMKKSSTMIYMNRVTANDFFMLYGLPSVIMEGQSMIDFLKQFRLLLMDKGTNVVYRVKDLIGYEYTDIYTLIMVKQQAFINGIPVYYTDDKGMKYPKQEIVFRRMGTADDNTSYFKYRDSNVTYTVDEITSGDPRWWNTKEVEEMLQTMNYTLSNSKYIQLSTHMSMDDVWWACTVFLRGLLDNRSETRYVPIDINFNLTGVETVNVFDAVLMLVIAMNWQQRGFNGHTFRGDMYLPNYTRNGVLQCVDMLLDGLDVNGKPNPLKPGMPYRFSSFNYDIKAEFPDFYANIPNMAYLEPDVFLPMLEKVLHRNGQNIGESIMHDVKDIYKYLETKLQQTKTIYEFRQTTDMFWHLFLVHPNRRWWDMVDYSNEQVLVDTLGITMEEYESVKNFFRANATLDDTKIVVYYESTWYSISIYDVLSKNALDVTATNDSGVEVNVFQNQDGSINEDFLDAFVEAINSWICYSLEATFHNSFIGRKYNYRTLVLDKVQLDLSGTANGPRTFEALLMRDNPMLYRALMELKGDGESVIMLMRSIIKALEEYCNAPLPALQYKALGTSEYIRILKEVISYFKSYMVEFSKEEFTLIFDGLFDHGGNSNMLRLYDEITHLKIRLLPIDSLSLYDASHAKVHVKLKDDIQNQLYDEALFRVRTTFQKIKNMGYEIWYDDGNRISKNAFDIPDTQRIVANIIPSGTAYKIVIPIENLKKPANYVGNTL